MAGFFDSLASVLGDAFTGHVGDAQDKRNLSNLGHANFLRDLGFIPQQIDPNAPGATVDTTESDAQRGNMQDLINALQQQAATGDGAWQQSFSDAVKSARSGVSAAGQSEQNLARTGGAGALRNIGNAQAGIDQRAIGQGNVLRQESENDAQGQLAQLLGSQGQGDISQAATTASVAQQNREANAALAGQAHQNVNSALGAGGSALMALSDGGRVPGQPKVFGDDERNDTVPAWLSPGEIVVPRSDAATPEKAAAFARAVALRHGIRKMAGGGDTGLADQPGPNAGQVAETIFAPHVGVADYFNSIGGPQAASIQNGGLLDTSAYDQTRGQMGTLAGALASRAAGSGSVADTIARQQQDQEMAHAIAEQNNRRVAVANALQNLAGGSSKVAGEAGAKRGNEQSAAQKSLGGFDVQRRAQEMALAKARQQAAFTNTAINAGLTLQNQQALRDSFASAGQIGSAISQAGGKSSPTGGANPYGDTPDAPGTQNTQDFNANLQPDPNDPSAPSAPGDYPDGGPQTAAHGGRIRGYDEGGSVRGFIDAVRNSAPSAASFARRVRSDVMVKPPPQRQIGKELHAEPVQHTYREPDDTSDFEVQRAKGGSIPDVHPILMLLAQKHAAGGRVKGYADGGWTPPAYGEQPPVATYAPPAGQEMPTEQPKGRSFSGAELGIGNLPGTPPAPALTGPTGPFTLPNPDVVPGASNRLPPVSHERAGETLVETGKTDTGEPIVAPRQVLFQNPLPPGLRLKEKPSPEVTPKKGGGGAPLAQAEDPSKSIFDRESASIERQGELAAKQAEAEAKVYGAQEDVIKQRAAREQEIARQSDEQASALMRQHNEALDEMKRIDTSVDPGRFWATRSTPQKISAIIGMALGSLGSRDGTNKAAEMIGQAIDRDIDAQKTQATIRLQKGEKALAGIQSAYAMNHQIFGDKLAALSGARATGLELAKNQLDQIAATSSSPMFVERAKQLHAQLDQAFVKQQGDTKLRTAQVHKLNAETAKDYADAARTGGGINPAEAKDLHTAEANAQDSLDLIRSIRGSLEHAQSPVPGKTALNENFGDEAQALGVNATQLTLKLKDMAKLGQISTTDQALLDKLLGDPQAVWGRGSSESSKQARLTALEGIVQRSIRNQRRAALGVQAQ